MTENIAVMTSVLNFLWMSYRVPHMLIGSLPEDRHPKSSHMTRWTPNCSTFLNWKVVLVTFNGQFFRKMCMPDLFLFIVQEKMIKKNQVLSIVSSLFVKNIQRELWTKKQSPLREHALSAIQNENELPHSNSVTFDAKESQRNPNDDLSGNTIIKRKTSVRLGKLAW